MEDYNLSSGGLPADLVSRFAVPLLREWPEPIDLTPSKTGLAERHRDFVQAAVALQDTGLIMYEALLVGTGPEPCARNACLTTKGRVHLIGSRGAEDVCFLPETL